MGTLSSLQLKADKLKGELYALSYALRDPRTPWRAKLLIGLVIGYALSPIDLIPDFIPVLGYVDDLLLVPAGISLAIKMIPQELWEEYKEKAVADLREKKKNWVAAAFIIFLWLLAIYLVVRFLWRMFMK